MLTVKRTLALVSLMMLALMLVSSASVVAEGTPPSGPAPGADLGASSFVRINNDTDLVTAAAFYGWDGQGRDGVDKPFLIDGAGIPFDAQGYYSAFYIGNTTLKFIMTDWTIYNCSAPPTLDVSSYSPGAAIALFNVTGPCSIESSDLSANPSGAWVEASTNITIDSVTCWNTIGPGLFLWRSSYGTLSNNVLQNNSVGISIIGSNHTLVDSNVCTEDGQGIAITGSSNVTITFNNCSSSTSGINTTDLVDSQLHDNSLWSDGTGLMVAGSRSVEVWGNLAGSCQSGITSEASNGINLYLNSLISCTAVGIRSNNTLAPHDISQNSFSGAISVGISLSNSTSATVRNNTLTGSSTAILLQSTSGCLVRQNGINPSQVGILALDSSSLTLVANQVHNCSLAGLELLRCGAPTVMNNTISNSDQGIWLRENCVNANVIGNAINAIGSKGIVAQGASTGAKITENVVKGQTVAGIQVAASNGVVLRKNLAQGCGVGILVQGGSGAEASNNTCTGSSRGMELNGTSSAIVKDNICQANTQAGIYIHSSSSSTLTRNNCSYNTGSGLIAVLGTGNKVVDGSFFGNALAGLRATGETSLQITSSRFGGNGAWGARLDSCSYPVLYGNVLSSEVVAVQISGGSGALIYQNQVVKATSGVVLTSTSALVMHDNLVQGCVGYAVDATSTSHSRFYLNIFLYNNGTTTVLSPTKRQARDDSSNDDWVSLTGQGNYWADMTTPDVNRDGMVDTPYTLAGKASDNKPLSGPLGPVTGATFKKGKVYVLLTWGAPNYTAFAPLTQYYIDRMNSTGTVTFTLPASQTAFNDTSISDDSDYTYDIRARSSLGASVIISLDVPRRDAVPPVVLITVPAYGSSVNSTSIIVSWTATDQGSGLAHFDVSVDSGLWQDVGLTTSALLPPLAQGWHEVLVRAWDLEGNSGTNRTRFFVDAYAPVLTITLPAVGSAQNQSGVQVAWTA
ncbi:MAG: right-handed parallel beta-helix repeat-containing protein, partial [Methanomassiliicoccales archaeon]|nr:right-handed parallel beta-helix repeat-containing protein [Methanomassiliicoccales archaeon]